MNGATPLADLVSWVARLVDEQVIYICSADGSTHTESNKLYARSNIDTTQIFLHANG